MPASRDLQASSIKVTYNPSLDPTPWIVEWKALWGINPETGLYEDVLHMWRLPSLLRTRREALREAYAWAKRHSPCLLRVYGIYQELTLQKWFEVENPKTRGNPKTLSHTTLKKTGLRKPGSGYPKSKQLIKDDSNGTAADLDSLGPVK